MTIRYSSLKALPYIDKACIHSLDMSLYQLSVEIDGDEFYVTDDDDRMLRSLNLCQMQALLENLPVRATVLRQESAYDEMVGQAVRHGDNAMEIPLRVA
ncbi:DUF6482 family protein [Shewanella litorisediminis]|uniref:Na(+)-translocating NADH-quinone reductase subunit B n=1 Tax=Shewanella litorisediminis TaxID=1173586 RepID=A0ABX7G369_9GAMM|nr:DUF6482 family protein [Shewanella litorisediminis]MCL2917295.1 DUF6482 family protein [Shewanella litorisediminis]QRH01765.1 hypothetical protein JQC75_18285 [Shewanella litorisediminis]